MRSISLYLAAASLACMLGCSAAAPTNDDESPARGVAPAAELETNEATGGALSRAQAKTVLRLLDGICGDTWCEGDHNFRFMKVRCESSNATCTLFFLMFPYDTTPSLASLRTCKTDGFTGFASLVDVDSRGTESLTESYYTAISSCIDRYDK